MYGGLLGCTALTYGEIGSYYVDKWGEPSREMQFSNECANVDVLIWDPSEATMGVTMYATVGGSNYKIPGSDVDHRQEFYVGLLPEADNIAGALAMLAAHSTITGRMLDHGHFFRAQQPIIDERSGLYGFFLLSSFDENGDFEPPVVLADGRHVALFMAVPAFSNEIDFGLKMAWMICGR